MKLSVLAGTSIVIGGIAFAAASRDPMKDSFPEDQARITKVLSDIVDAAQKKQLDRLESFHSYTAKFTKFEDDGLGRQDAEGSRKGERDGLGAVKSFNAHVENLKVDVFGPVAVATFLLAYEVDTGKEKAAGKDRSTAVFVKDGGAWKIVHEHLSPFKPAP